MGKAKGEDHTGLVLGPQEKGVVESVEKVELAIAPANGRQPGQIQATQGTPNQVLEPTRG